MIIGVTGHRPTKLGSYTIPNPIYDFVYKKTYDFLKDKSNSKIITGMALGYDQIVAEICCKLKIPFTAAIPFVGQELLWPKPSQLYYRKLLDQAEQVITVSPGGFASWKMQARNQWIVNNSGTILACFDGSKGGTYNCVEYARTKNKPITIIDPLEYDHVELIN